ncbi:hypothetical protein R6Z07F_015456 [Ovis aries]
MFQAGLEERFCCGVAGCRCGGHTGLLLSPALSSPVASALLAWLRKAQEARISQPSLHVADSCFSLCPGLVCSAFSFQVKKRVGGTPRLECGSGSAGEDSCPGTCFSSASPTPPLPGSSCLSTPEANWDGPELRQLVLDGNLEA